MLGTSTSFNLHDNFEMPVLLLKDTTLIPYGSLDTPLSGNKIMVFFFNVPSKTQLGIVLWSHLCVVVASQSLYLDKKWRKKGSFSMNLLSKISAKAKNNLCSPGELIPGLARERSVTKPVDHQVEHITYFELSKKLKLTSKSWKPCAQYKNLGHFTSNFHFSLNFPNEPTPQISYCVTKYI